MHSIPQRQTASQRKNLPFLVNEHSYSVPPVSSNPTVWDGFQALAPPASAGSVLASVPPASADSASVDLASVDSASADSASVDSASVGSASDQD